MDEKKFIRTSGFLVVAGIFLFAYLVRGLESFYHSKLCAPLVFQESSPREDSKEFKNAVISDMQFLTTAFSVAAHFFVDGRGKDTLIKTIRDEFRNNKGFLEGVNLEGVRREGDVVVMPFTKKGAAYEANIYVRRQGEPAGDTGVEWGLSERFGIEVMPAKEGRLIEKLPVYSGEHEEIWQKMVSIHEINLKLIPPVEEGKVMWHVIPAELIPYSVRNDFVAIVSMINRKYPDAREKIKIVTERQDFYATVRDLADDPGNVVDVAVAAREDLAELPKMVKGLVFSGELADFRQLEGIIAALRALQQKEVLDLIKLYMLMTGESFKGNITELQNVLEDSMRLAEFMVFSLGPVRIHNAKELDELNRRLLTFIHAT
ncbi:MAG: hypothetical protein WBD24_07340 [Candidatus Omnitrophota bacterium]